MEKDIKIGQIVYWIYANNEVKPQVQIGVVSNIDDLYGIKISSIGINVEYYIDEIPIEEFEDTFTKRPRDANYLTPKHKMRVITNTILFNGDFDLTNVNQIQKLYDSGEIIEKKFDYRSECEWTNTEWKTKIIKVEVKGTCEHIRNVFDNYIDAEIACNEMIKERERFSSLSEEEQCKEEIIKYLSWNYAEEEVKEISDKLFSLGNIENLEVKVERYVSDTDLKKVLYRYFKPPTGIRPLKNEPKERLSMKKHREKVKERNAESCRKERASWTELT